MAEWYVYALAAMLLFSLANLALKELMKNDMSRLFERNRQAFTSFALAFATFLVVAWVIFLREVKFPANMLPIAALVLVMSLAGFVLLLYALKTGKVSLVTAILNVSTVVVAGLAVLFLGEQLTLKEAAGIAMAAAAIFLIAS
ncbi:MAG: EamA family transporter [Candidatus Micrarchaeota archaeon]